MAVVDLKMPGIDGVELCRRIKRTNSRTEVITKNKDVLKMELNASVIEQAKKKAALIFFREPMEKVEKEIKD